MKRSLLLCSLVVLAVMVLFPDVVLAATGGGGTGMPWDQPIDSIRNNVQNFIAPALIVLAIIFVGFSFVSAGHGVSSRAIGLVVGGSLALGVVAFMGAMGWAGATF